MEFAVANGESFYGYFQIENDLRIQQSHIIYRKLGCFGKHLQYIYA